MVWQELDDNDQPEEKTEALHSDVEVRKDDLAKLHALRDELVISNLA